MTEIDKMFENAGFIKKQCKDYSCTVCEQYNNCEKYPPFTAEKQIELIKWLSQHTYRNYIKFRFDICGLWYCECNMSNSDMHHTFEDALSGYINQIWESLTDQEKDEIRGILNE